MASWHAARPAPPPSSTAPQPYSRPRSLVCDYVLYSVCPGREGGKGREGQRRDRGCSESALFNGPDRESLQPSFRALFSPPPKGNSFWLSVRAHTSIPGAVNCTLLGSHQSGNPSCKRSCLAVLLSAPLHYSTFRQQTYPYFPVHCTGITRSIDRRPRI